MAEPVSRVEQQRGRPLAHDLVARADGDAAVADAVDVEPPQPRDAVRLDPAPVGRDQHVRGDARLLLVDADAAQRPLDERAQIVFADANRLRQR